MIHNREKNKSIETDSETNKIQKLLTGSQKSQVQPSLDWTFSYSLRSPVKHESSRSYTTSAEGLCSLCRVNSSGPHKRLCSDF